MSLSYEEKKRALEEELKEKEQELHDFMAATNYEEICKSATIFDLLENQQMIERFLLSEKLQNPWCGTFANYGEYVSFVKKFDYFEKKLSDLRNISCILLEANEMIQRCRVFIQEHRAFFQEYPLPHTNPELVQIAQRYLQTSPWMVAQISTNLRKTLVRQALLSLSQKDMQKALERHIVQMGSFRLLSPSIEGLSADQEENYEKNYQLCSEWFARITRQLNLPETEHILTHIVGVSFPNDDGTKRQDALKLLSEAVKEQPSQRLTLQKYEYGGAPAYYILWDNQCLGCLPKDLAQKLGAAYSNHPISGKVVKIYQAPSNGLFGCQIELEVDLSASLDHPELFKEKDEVEREKE